MNKLQFLFLFAILFLVSSMIWGIYMIPKQLDFSNQCEDLCGEMDKNYSVRFSSTPFTNINGECSCITKEVFVIEGDVEE